jgi:hypothetical protein
MTFNKIICIIFAGLITTPVVAQKKSASKRNTPPAPQQKVEPQKIDSTALGEDGYVAASSTHIDFSETAIDGRMKLPQGFMLQGNQGNQLSQMVKLRSNFRNELNNSKSSTKALVK